MLQPVTLCWQCTSSSDAGPLHSHRSASLSSEGPLRRIWPVHGATDVVRVSWRLEGDCIAVYVSWDKGYCSMS